jgi:hypothetical protein
MVRGVGERVLGRLFGGGGVGVGVRGWWWVFGVGMWLEGGGGALGVCWRGDGMSSRVVREWAVLEGMMAGAVSFW